jgi:amino acid adenylation domain-containing protein
MTTTQEVASHDQPMAGGAAGAVPDAALADAALTDGDTISPLFFAQEALWFLDQLDPGRAVYNVPQAWCLEGPLDVLALERGLQFVVDRHSALRATFEAKAGRPFQRIHRVMKVELPVTGVVGADASARNAEAMRLAVLEGLRPFDLAQGPLFRTLLLRLDERTHWLILVMHHITRDGASMAILRREWSLAYAAFRAGEQPNLSPLPLEYAEYVAQQREQLGGERLGVLLDYWRKRLDVAPTELTLPTDHCRPAVQSYAGMREGFRVSGKLVDALRALGREEGATLHMTLLAAFQVLLSRYADQDDILVGSPVGGRGRPELEGMIGYFANMVVHRGDLRGDPTFRELLQRTRRSAAEAYAHQDLPVDRLVEALAPQRDRSRNPLFQAVFTLQETFHTLAGPLALDGIESSPVDVDIGTAKFDLVLFLTRERSGLLGAFEYSTDLFEAPSVRRMIDSFLTLLEDIVRDPERPVSRLALLDDAGRRRILAQSRGVRGAYPAEASVPALFAATVKRAPAAAAVVDGARTLTYAELDQRSRQLAYRLLELGLRPGARVGVCMERSAEEIVALLGVLKAGGAYVPMDPAHPVERLGAIAADAGMMAVVTAGSAGRTLAASSTISALPIITLQPTDSEALADRPDPSLALASRDLAQVIYTSGSTGAPKGVAISHRAIAHLVCGTDYVHLRSDDVVAHVSNPAFDAATFEIFGALLNGARLALIARETTLSPRAFAHAIERSGITTLFLTTALFNQMARDEPTAFRGLRHVLFGGEAVEPRWVSAVLQDGRPERLLHVYGPTEATTFATWHEVGAVGPDASTVPIGRPIANAEVYVLDRHGEPVPVGVPGEICIAGPGLAAGYLGRPDLTAQRFVPHPFDRTPGARLYRTGDRACCRADGAIEFLGRFDRQLKIRGHRIEPAEVEAALLRLPDVRDAVVIAHGNTSDTRRLVAYVIPSAGAALTPADLARDLRRVVPAYLVPSRILLLERFPLTPNGKIDHRALPDPVERRQSPLSRRAPPGDPLEHMLAGIWEELLGLSNIGMRDNFFDIGGHSLLAAQLLDAIERACGHPVALTTFFIDPTIEHLARALRRSVSGSGPPVVALNAGGARPPFIFLHGDFTGGGFYTRQLSRTIGPDQPFYVVHPHGVDDSQVPGTIEAMAADRVRSLRLVLPAGPYALGGHCNGAMVALEMARQLIGEGDQVLVVVMLDSVAPLSHTQVWPPVTVEAGVAKFPHQDDDRPGAASPAGGDVATRYRRAIAAYRPAPYHGRIAVLRSEGTRDFRPSLGWSLIGEGVKTYDIPGNHITAITRHVTTTGTCIAACLEEAFDRCGLRAAS